MVTKKHDPGPAPRTLMQAHELLGYMRPSRKASVQTWLTYHRRCAVVYAEVAEIDHGHHHEALYWANRARIKAYELQNEITNNPDLAGRDVTVHNGL